MLVRNCAGGVVFFGDKVFLLKNDKGEWMLPKGVVRHSETLSDIALMRVKEETGIEGRIISTAGHTSYEFYSFTRQRPVCNRITWFIMVAADEKYVISEEFTDGGYFPIDEAIEKVTYSQDKALVNLSYRKYKEKCLNAELAV